MRDMSAIFDSTALHFPYVLGEPSTSAEFRSCPEDFIVREQLGFSCSGEGEHLYVHLEKIGENTQWVAEKLAQFFSLKVKDVGFCGLKDRHAISSQWFSLYLPTLKEEPDWEAFIRESESDIRFLASGRHSKKLRRGEHQSNTFCIRLRNAVTDEKDQTSLEQRITQVQENGVPNYFGEQRFGREANNLNLVQEWVTAKYKIKNSKKRSIIYSSARSYIFNSVLAQRVRMHNWNSLVEGEAAIDGVPTGPMWGRGRSAATGEADDIEQKAVNDLKPWCDALEHVGLNQERRALVLTPRNLSFKCEGADLVLGFELPPGQYATAILREICQLKRLARS